MSGNELRERIKRLDLSYTAAAPRLGLSLAGLHHNMRGERKITRQAEIILDYLERERAQPKSPCHRIRQQPAAATR